MPIIESVMGIQVIGNSGENIIKSPIVEAYIGSSLLDSTEVASDTPTDISTKVEQLMAAKHSHSNKAVLDKFAEGSDGKPTYNGIAVGGGTGGASTAANVSYTNTQLPNVKNVKTALDELVPDSHNHNNKNILDKFSDSNGKLQYNGSDISITKNGVITALGYTPEAVSAQVATGSNITLADNTEYRLTDVTTLTLTYPTGNFECWMRLTFAASGNITVTLPADTEYLGATPNFKNGETWELSFKDKVLAAKKTGADDGGAGGENGVTPHIGENGNWYIGNTDTGKPSRGENGITPHIGENGNWYLGDTDTGKPSRGEKGDSGDAGDFIIKMTVEADGDNYTVTSCDATVEQIDAAFGADKNIVLTVAQNDETNKYVLSLTYATPEFGYLFESFYDTGFLIASIDKTNGATFAMTQTPANAIDYSNAALPNISTVGGALDALVPKSHTHDNKDTLDKLSVSNGKLQYNGSDVGLKGADGKTPVKGTDYWTAADKQEIVNDVIAALPDGTEVSY